MELRQAASDKGVGMMHIGKMRIGFYEWVEFIVRLAYVNQNGKSVGIAWAADRFMLQVASPPWPLSAAAAPLSPQP